ncbi:hypothetical protein EUX98_g3177 [Antrodiella citrinella]|uniref:Uncharacterized protein n=1 Tax=Antrodiella citrinella TaxID=2447956 RepID=A0A4S4MZN3_9APHY|nr:hypothetical protein EUX98_g3177 [Antrodiella citrinella]
MSPSTNLKLSARAYTARSVRGVAAGSDFVGTVQHQFSPRLAVKIQTSLFLGRPVKVQAVYDDDSHSFAIHGAVAPAWFSAIYDAYKGNEVAYPSLPCTMTYSRRLFPHSNIHGTFFVSAPSPVSIPVVSFTVSSAHPFSFTAETDRPAKAISDVQPPSRTGLTRGVYYYSVGAFLGNLPGINMEYGITFTEVGLQLKAAVEVGLTGLSSILTAAWNGDNKGADAEVSLSTMGVQLKLGFVYLNHRMELPMIVSHEYDLNVAFWTILVPTTTLAIAYNLVLRPLEHKRRMEFFRQARRELRNAQSDLVRQTEETISLLQDVAKRHMQAETAVDGLVIIEGTYGVTVRDEYTEGLEVDVTIPLQALVNKSQLYIPGKRSKSSVHSRVLNITGGMYGDFGSDLGVK